MSPTTAVRRLDEAEGLPRLDARACSTFNHLYGRAAAIDFALRQQAV